MSSTTLSVDHPTAPWRRAHGPLLHLGWLDHGNLTEPVPDWFVEFYQSTRDVSSNDTDNDECGQTSLEENWVLYQCTRLANPADSLEIGVLRGATSVTIGRALQDHAPSCRQLALDLWDSAIASCRRRMERYGFRHDVSFVVADSHEWLPRQTGPWQFAFIDGDHSYDSVVADLVDVYNRLAVGGYITMHDIGTAQWGRHQDPGIAFFKVLDSALGESAALGWLDSTERNQDMRIFAAKGDHAKMKHDASSVGAGWGGMGIIHKLSDDVRLARDQFLPARPPTPPPPPPQPPVVRPSLLRRAVRKVKRKIKAFAEA